MFLLWFLLCFTAIFTMFLLWFLLCFYCNFHYIFSMFFSMFSLCFSLRFPLCMPMFFTMFSPPVCAHLKLTVLGRRTFTTYFEFFLSPRSIPESLFFFFFFSWEPPLSFSLFRHQPLVTRAELHARDSLSLLPSPQMYVVYRVSQIQWNFWTWQGKHFHP